MIPAISVYNEGTSRDIAGQQTGLGRFIRKTRRTAQMIPIGIVDSYQESPNWTVNIMVNNHPVEFSIDTGTDVTVISEHIYQQAAGKINLQPTSHKLCGRSWYTLLVMGKCVAKLKRGNCEIKETVYVVRSLHQSLLGRLAIESLDLVKRVNAIGIMTSDNIKLQFPKLYTGLGKLQGNCHIC